MYVPSGTPRSIVNQLYSALMKTMHDPETTKRLQSGGAEIVTSTLPEEFAVFMKTQNAFWAKIVKAVGAVARISARTTRADLMMKSGITFFNRDTAH